jgi:phosphonate transport system permease protein
MLANSKTLKLSNDVFAQKRRNSFIFLAVVIFLTAGSIVLTEYDVQKGFTSIFKAITWGISNFYPDAKSMAKLPDMLQKLQDTILVSIAATTVAAILALLLAVVGSRTTRLNRVFSLISRGIASVFRNIPLVGWAMVLMLAFSQGPFSGYLALFCGSLGFLTRAFMETIDEVGKDPVEGLSATGAGFFAIIFQAVLPASMPQMISWLLYMVETNIRDATLVGMLTGSGIGFAFELYYKNLNYHAASLTVVLVVITVIVIEVLSNNLRRLIL